MMRIALFTTAAAMWLATTVAVFAQENQPETTETSIEKIDELKEKAIEEEKSALKKEVEEINKKLENGLISTEESEELKKSAAEKRAKNIDNRLAIIDNQIELQERNHSETEESRGQLIIDFGTDTSEDELIFGIKIKNRDKKIRYDRRTTTGFHAAVGLNNVITKGESLDDSEFKIGGSRFFELGWSAKTRVFKNSNWLRFKYGLAFQFNGLKPVDNQFFVTEGDQTVLETFPLDLKKSKFRMDNLVVPLFLEFGPSKKIDFEDYFRYSTYHKPAFAIGGYGGVNLGTRQKLKYTEHGKRQKDKIKKNYNTSNLIYGVSGYINWREWGVYAKYDLNPIFKDNPKEQRNISVGIRWDIN